MIFFINVYNVLYEWVISIAFFLFWNFCKYYNRVNKLFFKKIKNETTSNNTDEYISISFICSNEHKLVEYYYDTLEDVPDGIKEKSISTENDTNVYSSVAGDLFIQSIKYLPSTQNCISSEENRFIVRILPFTKKLTNYFTITPCKTKILFAEYKNNITGKELIIENLNEYCNIGNELFNPTFIYKMLDNKNKEKMFCNDYEFVVMDSNLNVYNITYNKYLYLDNERFEVKEMYIQANKEN